MKTSKKKLPKHYDSIDAPVYVWKKIHETGDMAFLLIDKVKLTPRWLKALIIVWNKIYDEYLQTFGYSETFLDIKEKEVSIAKMQRQVIITQDRTLLTEIAMMTEELKDLNQQVAGSNFTKAKIAIENECKFHIDEHKISIREFYERLNNLK